MYYISKEGTVRLAVRCKRLCDFTGKEGQTYTVRTRKKVELADMLPTYEFKKGKLRKTESFNTLWWNAL